MLRFYVCPKTVFEDPHVIAGHLMPRYNLFWNVGQGATGSHYMDLPNGMVLLCTDFNSEWAENEWHAHNEVARLPHPTHEGNVPLSHLHQKHEHAHKKFKKHHFDAIHAAIPLTDTDTVWHLNDKLKAAGWPALQISNIY